MKRINLLTTLFTIIYSFQFVQAQDCIQLPDTIYHCGFTLEVMPTEFNFPGIWIYDCEDGDGNIAIQEINNGIYQFTFSNCGYYSVRFYVEECDEEKLVVFRVDDPSYTHTEINGNNSLGYFNYSCHSDGSSCDNVVTIEGELPPDPEWDICYDLFCEYKHYFTTSTPDDPENCLVQLIEVDSVSGANSSSSCSPFDATDMTADIFCDIVDSIYNQAISEASCPPVLSECFDIPESCIDSITYDTIDLLFPIHDGGRWTMLEGIDTIILDDTTSINKYMKDLLFIIEPGADYYGPGDLTFTLLEIDSNGDTIPTAFDAEFVLWWQELWHYDTLTQIIPTIHYADDPECQSCGGNSFSSSKNIPGIPEYLCPPITISFGDPCSCEEGAISITGGDISCYDPCTILVADVNFSEPNITIDSAYWTGPAGDMGGSNTITVCEGGVYSYTVITAPHGCEYSESFVVQENFNEPMANISGNLVIDCIHQCATIIIEIFSEFTSGIIQLPDGENIPISDPTTILDWCQPGSLTIELLDTISGCTNEYTLEIIDETEDIEFMINPTETITCLVECVPLTISELNVPAGADYLWTGPNGFTANTPNTEACEAGIYVLMINYGNCWDAQTIEVFDFFESVEIQEAAEVCEGDCYIFQGQLFCESGIYSFEGACDSLFILDLTVHTPDFIDKYEFICEGDQVIVDGMVFDSEGIFPYEIQDGNLCPTFVTLEVEVFEMDLFVSGTPSIDCNNSTTILSVSTSNPEQNFYWYDPQNQVISTSYMVEVSEAGTYTVQNVSSNNLCIAELQIVVQGNFEIPALDLPTHQEINCQNEIQLFADIDMNEDIDFYWTGPNMPADQQIVQNPIVTEPGIYELIIENEFGCTNSASVELIQLDPLTASIQTDKTCENEANGRIEVELISGGVAPFQYRLIDGEYQSSNVFENVEAGEHIVYILQGDGCISESEAVVENIAPIEPIVQFEEAYELCDNPSLEFDLSEDLDNHKNWNIVWSDGSNALKRTFEEAGDYSLTIYNECEERAFDFRVDDSRLQDDLPIYIANMFTPNNDGVNDLFEIHTAVEPYTFEIDIYDRWGNKVFESQDINFSWDGLIHQTGSKSDVFAYITRYSYLECKDEIKEFQIIGDVTLIR